MIDIANKKSLEIWTLNSAGATAKKFQRDSRLDCYGVIEFKTIEAIKFHLYKVPMHINHRSAAPRPRPLNLILMFDALAPSKFST